MREELLIRPTTEADRTYIARLNFLTDVFGDEMAQPGTGFDDDFLPYVERWTPERGGAIAWKGNIPAGGAWTVWGSPDVHGFGFVDPEIPELAIAVERRFNGQGIGTKLLDAVTDLARSWGAPGISLCVAQQNTRARSLYAHVGFQDVEFRNGYHVMLKDFK